MRPSAMQCILAFVLLLVISTWVALAQELPPLPTIVPQNAAEVGPLSLLHLPNDDYVQSYVVTVSSDNLLAVAASHDVLLYTLDDLLAAESEDAEPQTQLQSHEAIVTVLTFSPHGAELASSDEDGMIYLWDAQAGEAIATLEGHESAVRALAFSPDGALLASGGDDGALRLWDVQTVEEIANQEGQSGPLTSLAFHPYGAALAAGYRDGSIRLWPIASLIGGEVSAEAVLRLDAHSDSVNSLAFQPQGALMASASDDRTLRLWRLTFDSAGAATSEEWAVLRGHRRAIASVSFSPDGSLLISAAIDRTLRLWNPVTTESLAVLEIPDALLLFGAAFTSDGSALVSASAESEGELTLGGVVRVWSVTEAGTQLVEGSTAEETPDTEVLNVTGPDASLDGTGASAVIDLSASNMVAVCTVSPTTNVNMRSGPGADYYVAAVLQAGEFVGVDAQATTYAALSLTPSPDAPAEPVPEGGTPQVVYTALHWWRLTNGFWVRADAVNETGDCSAAPVLLYGEQPD